MKQMNTGQSETIFSDEQNTVRGIVSIIVVTYNRADLIEETLRSIVAQSQKRLEVIIVDDGSSDGTAKEVERFGKLNPYLFMRFIKQKNAGPSVARNIGMEYARGNYIQFLDSDDLLYPDKISKQIRPLIKGEADVVYSDYEVWNSDLSQQLDSVCLIPEKENILKRLVMRSIQLGAALHTRKAVEATGGFNTQLWTSEDWDFHLREYVLAGQRFKYVPCTGLKYRWSGNSLCSNYIHVLRKKLPVVIALYDQFEREGKLTAQLKMYFGQLAAQCAFRSYRSGVQDLGGAYDRLAKSWAPRKYFYGSWTIKTAMRLLDIQGAAELMNRWDRWRYKLNSA